MYEHPCHVILYGDTLILHGVRASLASRPGLEISWLDPALERPLDFIRARCPAVLVFDLGAAPPDLRALLQQPGLLLIGIEPETHRALVWSAQALREPSGGDLAEVIGHQMARLPSSGE